jgi:hypothetical protein
MTIVNKYKQDAVVQLVDNTPARAIMRRVYVRAEGEATLADIAAGVYLLQFTTGSLWDRAKQRFLCAPSYSEGEKPLEFTETRTKAGTEYTTRTITLNPGTDVQGPIPLERIREADFGKVDPE